LVQRALPQNDAAHDCEFFYWLMRY